MLKITMILISLFTISSFAAAKKEVKGEKNIAEQKIKVTANIDKRIASLTAMKGCVNTAADRKAIKACREKHRDAMKSMKDMKDMMGK